MTKKATRALTIERIRQLIPEWKRRHRAVYPDQGLRLPTRQAANGLAEILDELAQLFLQLGELASEVSPLTEHARSLRFMVHGRVSYNSVAYNHARATWDRTKNLYQRHQPSPIASRSATRGAWHQAASEFAWKEFDQGRLPTASAIARHVNKRPSTITRSTWWATFKRAVAEWRNEPHSTSEALEARLNIQARP
jgi:hypothetical protein